MSHEKYKQICFSPVGFFLASSERIAYVPFASCLHLSQGQIWDPINNWGRAFCGDSHQLLSQKVGFWRGDECPSVVCYFLRVPMTWKVYCLFHLVFILLICYWHCYYTIQMHVEDNSLYQLHAFYWSTQRWGQITFHICVGTFLQVKECTSEVLLFLWY